MSEETSFLANPEVSMRKGEGGRALLYNSDTGALITINSFGLIIWQYLKNQPRTKTDIVAHFERVSDNVPVERAEADVEDFLKNLQEKGFIGEVLDITSTTPFEDPMKVESDNGSEDEELTDPGHVNTKEGWPVRSDGRIFPYRGSSMRGAFRPGDFVETEKCRLKSLRRGDVIVFRGSEPYRKDNLIVHRIVRIKNDSFITQGDNNRIPDLQSVIPSQIVGKAISFERSSVRRRVINGWPGLIIAKAGLFIRRSIRWVYKISRWLWPTRLVRRMLHIILKSPVRTIRVSTRGGMAIKWIWRNRTIAWRHEKQEFLEGTFLARYLIENNEIKLGS